MGLYAVRDSAVVVESPTGASFNAEALLPVVAPAEADSKTR